jgi:hypothetical protein
MLDKFSNFLKKLNLDPLLENTINSGFKAIVENETNYKDEIPGGLADKKSPKDFDKEQLAKGMKVESEHTSDPKIAREIAMDHLTEDKDYYTKLEKIEKK